MRGERIIVIADDITGAAEMAGIAHRFGLRVQLFMSTGTAEAFPAPKEDTDVLVIATDTRSMTEAEAVAETCRLCRILHYQRSHTHPSPLTSHPSPLTPHLFKKTDSALRGHVVAELEAILHNTNYRQALYIPANPSKGRTIRNGIYYINGKPIHETDFSFDPEFPATTSSLAERFSDCHQKSIYYADATSNEDIRKAVSKAPAQTLFAGAADLFEAVLKARYEVRGARCEVRTTPHVARRNKSTLIVCGSTQSKPIDCGIRTSYMPTAVYDGREPVSTWGNNILPEYQESHSMILALRDTYRNDRESAVYLRNAMAETVHMLVDAHRPQELIIEGGATAFAILQRLQWLSFTITHEIAPGVIRMQVQHSTPNTHHPSPNTQHPTFVTMKPGSYPWGQLF